MWCTANNGQIRNDGEENSETKQENGDLVKKQKIGMVGELKKNINIYDLIATNTIYNPKGSEKENQVTWYSSENKIRNSLII